MVSIPCCIDLPSVSHLYFHHHFKYTVKSQAPFNLYHSTSRIICLKCLEVYKFVHKYRYTNLYVQTIQICTFLKCTNCTNLYISDVYKLNFQMCIYIYKFVSFKDIIYYILLSWLANNKCTHLYVP